MLKIIKKYDGSGDGGDVIKIVRIRMIMHMLPIRMVLMPLILLLLLIMITITMIMMMRYIAADNRSDNKIHRYINNNSEL
ncbi:hypothetical protein DPMN_151528 [Dreissena polymorpha]|uniref:Uncharacterized protein n=1 Tax=Dreissena polymorpha TaxID=45954 RepID=A0A9D4FIL8_DREPO|nr:hypothetical protein DPMN_151528 [Dreissena polymorpha]